MKFDPTVYPTWLVPCLAAVDELKPFIVRIVTVTNNNQSITEYKPKKKDGSEQR